MPAPVPLRAATAADRDEVLALLAACELPTGGVEAAFPDGYVVARRGARLVGVAGLERHGDAVVLRSVAVSPELRGTGLGIALTEDRLAAAGAAGAATIYLLTTTAARFYDRFGFTPFPRDQVPAAVAASPEFALLCPSSAACMARPVR